MATLDLVNQPKDDRGRVRVWAIPEGRWRWVEPVDAREMIMRGVAVLTPGAGDLEEAKLIALQAQAEANPIASEAQRAAELKAAEAAAVDAQKALEKVIAAQKADAQKAVDAQKAASAETLKAEAAAAKAAPPK